LFFFQAEDGIRDFHVTGVQTCALPILPFGVIAQALGAFRGAKRRLEVLGEVRDVLIIDDYAHHPTEIRATLAALRNMERRVVAGFQPHRYTRTKHSMDELAPRVERAGPAGRRGMYATRE